MFRKRSRLCLATAPPAEAPGDDGDAPAVTPRRSLSLSFGAEQGGGSLHGGTSLGAWAHGSAPAGDPGWAHQLWGQRDDGGEGTRWAAPQGAGPGACDPDDLDWQPSQPALAPGAPAPGGAFFSPRGAGGETWQGEAVMESPQAGPGGEAAAAEGRADSGANAWTRFASALAQAGSAPADGDGGTLSPGGSGRGGTAAVSGALDGSWGTDAQEALYAPPWLGRAPCEPGHPGAGLRRDDTAAALACGGEGDGAHARAGCWAEPGASGHPRGLPAPLSDDDLSAGQRELQLQEQFWAGAFPPAPQQARARYQEAAPPPPPPYQPAPPPRSLDAWVDDVTRTPPPPVILPEFSAALLVAAAGGAHHAYDMSPGEGRCSQYIHSPAPLSLSQYGQPGGEWVGQEQLGAGLHLHHVPPNQANSPSALCAGPQAHGADEPEERAAQPLRPALFPIFLPKGSRKLHLVRHGESEYNAACSAPGSSWDEPRIFDAQLTPLGRQQAQALGAHLAGLLGPHCVWVTSPLTRAIQTCVLARQAVGAVSPTTWAVPPREKLWLAVRPELAEHLVTSGDVGRPRQALCEAFPDLAAGGAFRQLSDVWWYSGTEDKPNCCILRRVDTPETRENLRVRVGNFRKWVMAQPGKELVVFGHSTFFKYLIQGEGHDGVRLKNGQVMTIQL